MASAVVVLVTPHASSGFADFRLYFTVGDWLTLRLPLVAALCVTVAAALTRERVPRARVGALSSVVYAVASWVRVFSVGVGAACGSLTVGILFWLVVLRIEATDRYFPHYLDWPLPSFVYTVIYAASIGLGSLVFALRRDDALRAGYFMLCSGLLALVYSMGVVSYDVVGATYGWPGLAAFVASALTLVGATRHIHVLLAIGLAIVVAATLFALAFARWPGAVLGLLALQALTLRAMVPPHDQLTMSG